MVTSVRLPLDRRPAFPQRCVLCGVNNPGETIDLKRSVFPRGRLLIHLLTRSEVADLPPLAAPACARCRHPFRSRPFWTVFKVALFLGILVAYLAGFAYLYFLLVDHLQGRGVMPRRAAAIAQMVMIVCSAGSICAFVLAGVTAQRRLFPAPVHVESSASELLFEFRDEAYGREFETLNHPGVGVRADPGEAPTPARA